jgi:hypothetical protein
MARNLKAIKSWLSKNLGCIQVQTIKGQFMEDSFMERRSKPRSIIDQYHSVEFSISESAFAYQFKIWDISPKGICVLVMEDSGLLNRLKAGDILNLKYYTTNSSRPIEYLETEIRDIAKDENGRFKGLYLVGLSILTAS